MSFVLFSPKEKLLIHTRLFVRRMENVIAIRMNWFK